MSDLEGSPRLLVKICGLREPEHAAWAAQQGADLLMLDIEMAARGLRSVEQAEAVVAARPHAVDQAEAQHVEQLQRPAAAGEPGGCGAVPAKLAERGRRATSLDQAASRVAAETVSATRGSNMLGMT